MAHSTEFDILDHPIRKNNRGYKVASYTYIYIIFDLVSEDHLYGNLHLLSQFLSPLPAPDGMYVRHHLRPEW